METMTLSAFREHLAGTLDKVNEDHRPVLITRPGAKAVVVMGLDEFQAYEERANQPYAPETVAAMIAARKGEVETVTLEDLQAVIEGKLRTRAIIETEEAGSLCPQRSAICSGRSRGRDSRRFPGLGRARTANSFIRTSPAPLPSAASPATMRSGTRKPR